MKKYNHQQVIDLLESGHTLSEIAAETGISKSYAQVLKHRLFFHNKTTKSYILYISQPTYRAFQRYAKAYGFKYPSPFINHLLRHVVRDNLVDAILDEKVPENPKQSLTSFQ